MTAKLREIIDEILRQKSWVQDDLAQYIGVKQPAVSKMRNSGDWNLHWQAFVKLLPLLHELRIDPASSLRKDERQEDRWNDHKGIIRSFTPPSKDEKVPKKQNPPRHHSNLSARRTASGKRRNDPSQQ